MAERTALVVAGAGARGAYEAGVLRALLPAMAAEGAMPSLLFGTSAGALNAVALGALAHEQPAPAVSRLVELWTSVELDQVASVPKSLARDAALTLWQVLGGHPTLHSLLDTTRLADAVEPLIDWKQLHANVRDGAVDAVAVATTSTATQGTVVFVEHNAKVALPPADTARDIVYVSTKLSVEHALASSAIPVAFRAVEVSTPASSRGWYVDGGTRLNVPIKPALSMGATRLAVVSTHPSTYPATTPRDGAEPDIASSAAQLLRGALSDRMVEDLHNLEKINRLVAGRSQRGQREVPFVFAGPSQAEAGDIAACAQGVFEEQARGLRTLIDKPGLWLLARLVGGSAADHGDLLSYLYFDPAFTAPAADLGTRHAEASIGRRLQWRTQF